MRVTLKFNVDWQDAVQDVVTELLHQQDAVYGVGADGTTDYEVTDVDADVEDDGSGTVTFDLQHVTGKFAARDEVMEILIAELSDQDVTITGTLTVEEAD